MEKVLYYSSWMAAKMLECLLALFTYFKISQYFAKAFISWFFGSNIFVMRREFNPLEKRIENKLILPLPSFGCTHYFIKGGCKMCGFNEEIKKYHFRQFHPQILIVLTKLFLLYLGIVVSKTKIDVLAVFMAGSFFNDEELPLPAQDMVLDFFRKKKIPRLLIESRAEYIISNQNRIKRVSQKLPDQKIEIAIGLEAVDEKIRNGLIRKDLDLETYRQAVLTAKSFGFIVSTYILIGAPYLSAEKIIQSSIQSSQFAWQAGSDLVNLEVYCVQEGTIWAHLYKKGLLKIPSLWQIIEIIKSINKISPYWCLGEFSDWPPPLAVPTSCSSCREQLKDVLAQIRLTHNMKILEFLPECSCRDMVK
jgi:radical SAM enzyme (TIGR01210 family)